MELGIAREYWLSPGKGTDREHLYYLELSGWGALYLQQKRLVVLC